MITMKQKFLLQQWGKQDGLLGINNCAHAVNAIIGPPIHFDATRLRTSDSRGANPDKIDGLLEDSQELQRRRAELPNLLVLLSGAGLCIVAEASGLASLFKDMGLSASHRSVTALVSVITIVGASEWMLNGTGVYRFMRWAAYGAFVASLAMLRWHYGFQGLSASPIIKLAQGIFMTGLVVVPPLVLAHLLPQLRRVRVLRTEWKISHFNRSHEMRLNQSQSKQYAQSAKEAKTRAEDRIQAEAIYMAAFQRAIAEQAMQRFGRANSLMGRIEQMLKKFFGGDK